MNNNLIGEISNLSKIHQKWLNEYLQNIRRQEKSPLTIQSYRSDLTHFLLWFELTVSRAITVAHAGHVAQYQEFLKNGGVINRHRPIISSTLTRFFAIFFFWRALHKQTIKVKIKSLDLPIPLAPSTRKRRLTSIKKFFDYLGDIHRARGEKLFQVHPISPSIHHIKLKDADIEHTKLLGANELEILAENMLYPEDRLLIFLLFDGGLRISEATGLRFSNFDWERGTIELIRKGGKRHKLQLRRKTRIFAELERVRIRQIYPSDFVFAAKDGQRAVSVRTLQARIKKYLDALITKKGLSAHSFRKGCATELYQKTRDLLHVRDYLNHQNALVTQTYIEGHGQYSATSEEM